jgi:hypothetical protein
MTTVTRDTSLLKDALAKARFVGVHSNKGENPGESHDPKIRAELEQLGLIPPPEYAILVVVGDDEMLFRGFLSEDHAWDAIEAVSPRRRPVILQMTEEELRTHLIAEQSARMANMRAELEERHQFTRERFDELFSQKRLDEAIEDTVSLWKNGHLVPVEQDGKFYFRYGVNIGQKHGDKQ